MQEHSKDHILLGNENSDEWKRWKDSGHDIGILRVADSRYEPPRAGILFALERIYIYFALIN